MSKELNPKPMVYAAILGSLQTIAKECGYALAVHGSLATDLDIIAVRWSENYESPSFLAKAFVDAVSRFHFEDKLNVDFPALTKPEVRFETHTHYTIPIIGSWYIDLCIVT